MKFRITVLGGDGIGPEVTRQAVKVLRALEEHIPHSFELDEALIGGAALWATGYSLPRATLESCRASDAVLLGAVGDERWDQQAGSRERSTLAALQLRKALGCYANLRPVQCDPTLFSLSHLKERVLGDGVDLIIVRDMSGGLFYSEPRGYRTFNGVQEAVNTMAYSRPQVERIAHVAFNLARRRRHKVTSVDQANVLESQRLWREVVTEVATRYPDVELEHLYVDNCAHELGRRPYTFDVILTDAVFGGILSDQAAVIAGSMGMLPSVSLGDTKPWIFEPVHGSAPKHAGYDRVNPVAAIRSLALLLDLALDLRREAKWVEEAIRRVVARGTRTYDIALPGSPVVGTEAMGDAIAAELHQVCREYIP